MLWTLLRMFYCWIGLSRFSMEGVCFAGVSALLLLEGGGSLGSINVVFF